MRCKIENKLTTSQTQPLISCTVYAAALPKAQNPMFEITQEIEEHFDCSLRIKAEATVEPTFSRCFLRLSIY